MSRIKSISVGTGEKSVFFSTSESFIGHPAYVHHIEEAMVTISETMILGKGMSELKQALAYEGYEDPGRIRKFRIFAGPGVIVTYE